ncbi:MAG: hypothetical protein OXD40_02540 [bacterium]|nr:hypothetical protein [bacterium]
MNYRTPAALAAAFILASCGRGGRDDGPPVGDASSFDTIVVGDVLIAAQERLYGAESSCSGSTCTVMHLDESVTVDLRDLDPSTATTAVADRQTRNGVQTGRLTASDGETRFDAFGVWGDYNAATTGAGTISLQGADIRFVVPTSVGHGSAANPVSGGASWAGAMTGVKVEGSGLGAKVTVDFADAALAFTNIAGAGVSDISWQDVPMEEGSFSDDGLDGRFYGPSHEEAGGVFERDDIAGAFSLKRD